MNPEPIHLNIEYSQELEVSRVVQTLKKLDWYREHGYLKRLYLPAAISAEQGNVSEDAISSAVAAEYDQSIYASIAQQIAQDWDKIATLVTETLKLNNITTYKTYIVRLTRYGTGGSYHAPNVIVVNFAKMNVTAPAIVHEIIHLSVERFVEQYAISQQQKERFVELLTERILPSMQLQRKTPGCLEVEDAFAKHFPKIEEIMALIKK